MMPARWFRVLAISAAMSCLVPNPSTRALEPTTQPARRYDLSKDHVLYCIGYAHLDTQWRWDFCTTIDRFIRDTLDQNFDRFEKYPGYVFNFTGSVRYEMMREYYPEKYLTLKEHIAAGRWFVSGSSVDEGDVNVPSAEAIIRQVLYGNQYFRREFGKESLDFMLPDCFGFPASMPSIWAHCGLIGFSTQKLTWGSAVGIPFKIGVWEGPDGRSVIAAFDPGPYVGAIKGRVDTNPQWVERVEKNGERYGVYADYHYYGVGDMGGAPQAKDVENYLGSIGNADGKITVALTSSDQMYRDVTPEQKARLPKYRGDLLLTEHSAGTLTSQSYMKRWNRKNEILADAAERAAVAANWLGAAIYPNEKLHTSWVRLLANQMHDILPGTSIPRAYRYSWNDEVIALNGFAAVLQNSIGGWARAMNTRGKGRALVVYNPLAIEREDIVEAEVQFGEAAPRSVRVFGPDGIETPSQVLHAEGDRVRLLFVAKVPPVGLAVFDVRSSGEPFADSSGMKVTDHSVENEHYSVTIDDAGDVSSIIDKSAGGRELLSAPARLVFTFERPRDYPAWNMDWADRKNPPIDFVKGPAKVRVVEEGPVRVSIEVERAARSSIITQRIRLSRGDAGQRVEIANDIDWQSTACALKASFPLIASNPKATYNWGLGTIERANNEPTRYEVPSHEWFDLTDKSGEFGVSILEDCKFGSDKPADNEMRLTLLYTPGVRHSFLDQHSQDWGRHEILYALYSHEGDWRQGRSEWQGRRVNQPLIPFQSTSHDGPLGATFTMLNVSTPQVDVRAMKLVERDAVNGQLDLSDSRRWDSQPTSMDPVIIRVQELWGRPAKDVRLSFAAPVASAYETDGQERRIGDARIVNGALSFDLAAYSPRTFAVRLAPAPVRLTDPKCHTVHLDYNIDIVSGDADRTDGRLDSEGGTIPAEMLLPRVTSEGIVFDIGSTGPGEKNAVACDGQAIQLPEGEFNRLYLLAAAESDTAGDFIVDGHGTPLHIQNWTGFIGQFDERIWDREFEEIDYQCDGKVTGLQTGYIKRDPIAWFCTHRHHPTRGNEAYRFSQLYKYAIELPAEAKQLTLPKNPKIKLVAATVAVNPNDDVHPAHPLYDDFSGRKPIELRYQYPEPPPPVFTDVTPVGTVKLDRQSDFTSLSMGPPSAHDYADRASGHGVVFRVVNVEGQYTPHPSSGVEKGEFSRLNDGRTARNADDTEHCVWYDGPGRFVCELGASVRIDRINSYSWHRSNRAPQYFSVWGSNAEEMPNPDISKGRHDGWTLLGVVNSKELGQGGVHGSSMGGADGALGPYRHLLWAIEDVGEGTFFTEIDIHAAE